MLNTISVREIMRHAYERHIVVPAFNAAYLPMVKPIVDTLKALNSFGLVEVARPDITKFGAESFAAVAAEFRGQADRGYARLHQDHVPVIDEEGLLVDWESLIQDALDLAYDSVMVDGSRLPLAENIRIARRVTEMARPDVAVEAELGAVLGHEAGPLPPYDELFASGRGFTDVDEAGRFVAESGVDWLSVAVGNIHGAISGARRDEKKVQARLNIEHLSRISERVGVPLVLHGGTGITLKDTLDGVRHGITKINIGTAIRQAYEQALRETGDLSRAQEAVAESVAEHIRDFQVEGSASALSKTDRRL